MLPLIVIVVVFAVLRTAGALGVTVLKDWRLCLRWAMALMLLVTASGHWGLRRADLVAMVPPAFPNPELLVTLTGILEIAGAIGLVYGRTSRLAAVCLAILFVAMFPANVYAARHGLTIAGAPVTALPLRTFVQVVLIAAAAAIAWPPQWPAYQSYPRSPQKSAGRTSV
ncbi:MAG TPA: DoxX family membrane protein [Thermoanaerobaculia bacterium]|nr:DoxX family membrane protein [Thermoanaerobaculia bacterium]